MTVKEILKLFRSKVPVQAQIFLWGLYVILGFFIIHRIVYSLTLLYVLPKIVTLVCVLLRTRTRNNILYYRLFGFGTAVLCLFLVITHEKEQKPIIIYDLEDEPIVIISLPRTEEVPPSERKPNEGQQPDSDEPVPDNRTPDILVPVDNPTPNTSEPKAEWEVESRPKINGQLPHEWLNKHLRYPPTAKELGVEGTVIVQFTVTAEGKAIDIKVLKGIGFGCDAEVVAAIRRMPRFQPATVDGSPVASRVTLPVRFTIK